MTAPTCDLASARDVASDGARRPIPGYSGYRIDRDGQVWKGSRPIRPCKRRGYLLYALARPGSTPRLFRAHRLVLEAFVGLCPPGMQACHDNGDRADNRLANLRWDTPAANHADKVRHGRVPMGDSHPTAILVEPEVRAIRDKARQGARHCDLAVEFGVTPTHVGNLVHGRSWKHAFAETDRPPTLRRLEVPPHVPGSRLSPGLHRGLACARFVLVIGLAADLVAVRFDCSRTTVYRSIKAALNHPGPEAAALWRQIAIAGATDRAEALRR